MYGAYCTLEMYSAYCTLEMYSANSTLAKCSAYSTLNYIVPMAPQRTLCLLHLKEYCAYCT